MEAFVSIYTGANCPFCVRAKTLLNNKGVYFKEIDITHDQDLRQEMVRMTGKMTVPQILINGTPVGGCDDLYELDRCEELDRLLDLPRSGSEKS